MSLVVTTSSHLGVSKANNGWPEYPSPSTTGYDTIGIMVQKNNKKIIKKFTDIGLIGFFIAINCK